MTYAMAPALQQAVFQLLSSAPGVTALVGSAVYDAVPAGVLPSLYVTLGPEEARDASDKTGAGSVHDFSISVVSDDAGFQAAKTVAAAISDALHDAVPVLARGRVVALRFVRARARREAAGQGRRIDLRFRARLEDSE